MQIDPFPVRLEQELKYALAYAALVSAAANGRLPRDICQRTNVGYTRKCGVLPGNAAFCAEKFSGSRE